MDNEKDAILFCPKCRKQVRVIEFGGGYVAVCCDEVVYSGDEKPSSKPASKSSD